MRKFLLLLLILLIEVKISAFAQYHDLKHYKQETDTVYYKLSLESGNKAFIHQLNIPHVYLSFDDRYGKNGLVKVELLDWKGQSIKTQSFQKKYGTNEFRIKLMDWLKGWEPEKIYTFRTVGDTGKIYQASFSLSEDFIAPEPEVEILINPLTLDCEVLDNTLFEFYGLINGGTPPFTINWTILERSTSPDNVKTLSFQVPVAGYTSGIEVALPPSYNVILNVQDACGSEVEKAVLISCEEKHKNVNTLFFQQLRRDNGNSRIIN
ncbi:hypothetical protein [Litoribacter populi]|uniref:hypothetical protein n=1 Tax=Litoribacter populi TaxID=2598460 RepID=UPI001181529E|nr:hypothetical protein [Litoribacter populi]